jgi:hypothetical protein
MAKIFPEIPLICSLQEFICRILIISHFLEDIRRWKALSCGRWIGRNNIVKKSILPKASYMFSGICIKIPMTFFTQIDKSILKFIWKHKKKTQIVKAILSKKFNVGGITVPNFKVYYRVIIIKTAWYWRKNRHEDQWIRIEDPDIHPRSYSQPIFNKGAQNTRWRRDSVFYKCCWENWISTCRRLN